MGMDMSMFIVKDKRILANDIFEGRNSDWFRQMQGLCYGENDEFAHLHPYYNFEANGHTPDNLLKQYTEPLENDEICYYFDHRSIMVKDYLKWFDKYCPDIHAGWVRVYDAWAYKKKDIYPSEYYNYLPEGCIEKDWTFLTWEDKYDCSRWLAEWLRENNILDDAWIVYCFDN